jgi:hypothetical protein
VAKQIAGGQLAEPAHEQALIGFEEASDMRVYLFNLENLPLGPPAQWLTASLCALSIPISQDGKFARGETKPMSPIYGQVEGSLLRVKWGEQLERAKLDETTFLPVSKPVFKRAVLIADLDAKTAELRLNPPENKHAHENCRGPDHTRSLLPGIYSESAGCTRMHIKTSRTATGSQDSSRRRAHSHN